MSSGEPYQTPHRAYDIVRHLVYESRPSPKRLVSGPRKEEPRGKDIIIQQKGNEAEKQGNWIIQGLQMYRTNIVRVISTANYGLKARARHREKKEKS